MPARHRGIEPLHKQPCPTLIQHSPGRKPVTPPSSEEGVRVSPLVGAELGISVPAKEGPNAPPPTGNPAITGPQVCKQTQRGRTQPGPRGFARRPGNPCSAQNCMEAAVKRTPSPLVTMSSVLS